MRAGIKGQMVAASKARKIPQVNKRRTKGPSSPAFKKHFSGVPHLRNVLTFAQRCFFLWSRAQRVDVSSAMATFRSQFLFCYESHIK